MKIYLGHFNLLYCNDFRKAFLVFWLCVCSLPYSSIYYIIIMLKSKECFGIGFWDTSHGINYINPLRPEAYLLNKAVSVTVALFLDYVTYTEDYFATGSILHKRHWRSYSKSCSFLQKCERKRSSFLKHSLEGLGVYNSCYCFAVGTYWSKFIVTSYIALRMFWFVSTWHTISTFMK